jgi:hypothetical protein
MMKKFNNAQTIEIADSKKWSLKILQGYGKTYKAIRVGEI